MDNTKKSTGASRKNSIDFGQSIKRILRMVYKISDYSPIQNTD